ncbi:hypothetical protein [uncultured Aliiroseovarius sp.]|uniref:hypothetical protein n=1 Tax=uncultured Aliiroseovarius sp. TaxID=1658783 RepID=UPI002618E948|nr:hypothetical protein [uncultured Aliiroseovarius sp.]
MRGVLALLFILAPVPAIALSCMPYNAVSAYQMADGSPDDYVVVLGDLTFGESGLPKVDWQHQEDVKPDNFLTGHITGKSLTKDGFTNGFDQPVKINVQCAGPWCAGLSQGQHLMFLKRDGERYLLEVDPCGGFAFGDPDAATLQKIKACFRGERCEADLPRY